MNFNIFADYSQFYLLDGELQPPYPEDVTDQDLEQRFKVIPNLVAFYTVNPVHVMLSLELMPSEPIQNLETWEHVVEVPLDLPSGRLIIAGCTDYLPECPVVELAPGTYTVRTHARRGSDESHEEYLALLWLCAGRRERVLKQQVVL